MIDNFEDDDGHRIVLLVDRRATMKAFEFDQVLLMPTAKSYRALVEQAKVEIKPRAMKYLKERWSMGTIENLSFTVMAVAVYARSILDPPISIDVGKVLLRAVSRCNRRCVDRKGTGRGCRMAMNSGRHHLPKCIKLPGEISSGWDYLIRYIATGGAVCPPDAIGAQEAMRVEIHLRSDFAPEASC